MGGAALRIWRRIKVFKAIVLTLVVSLILGNLSMFCHVSFYSIFGLKDVDYILMASISKYGFSLRTLKQTSFLKVDMATWHSGRKHRLHRDASKQTRMETEIKFQW
jgi:hypothetical protein